MKIETDEQYQDAIRRLEEIGAEPSKGAEQDEFFQINAAMVDYETRSHPALDRGAQNDRG